MKFSLFFLWKYIVRSAFGLGVFLCTPVSAWAQWLGVDGTDDDGNSLANTTELPGGTFEDAVNSFMLWIIALVGFFSIIALVISGIMYLTSAGNDKQISTAKTAMTWSIVGIIVALSGYIIINTIDFLLSTGA